jgi:hypothetical protein
LIAAVEGLFDGPFDELFEVMLSGVLHDSVGPGGAGS